MHPTSLHPAYLVISVIPGQTPTETRFANPDLLTARRAAITYAESLSQRSDEEPPHQLEVYLIEQEHDQSAYNRIAYILQHHIGPDGYLLSSPIAQERSRCLDNLTQLFEEGRYYHLHQRRTGLGGFRIRILHRNHDVISEGDIVADALVYVNATVDACNQFESEDQEIQIQVDINDNRSDPNAPGIALGYLVDIQSTTLDGSPSVSSFLNEDLLTARQAAFQCAQQRVNRKRVDEQLVVNVYLAEFDGQQVIGTYLACVFNQRFDDPVEEPAAFANIFNTCPDRLSAHERFDSPLAVWKSLSEMSCEYECYRSYNHPPGFGFIKLTLHGLESIASASPDEGLSSGDSQLQRASMHHGISEIPQPLPYKGFWLIYDGLGYALSLIERYNRYYGQKQGRLRYTLDELLHTYA